jgi:hypothetical protein
MTKAELIAAMAAAPDEATVYIDTDDGLLRSHLTVTVDDEDKPGEWTIVLAFDDDHPDANEEPSE